MAVRDDLPHHADRLPVRLAAPDGEAAERPDEGAEAGDPVRLHLRHVVEDARARPAEHDGIEPGEVVRRDDAAARRRHAILSVDLEARRERRRSAQRRAADGPRDVGRAHRTAPTRSTIRSITCSSVMLVVSTSTASDARCVLAASRSSRRCSSAASSSTPRPSRSSVPPPHADGRIGDQPDLQLRLGHDDDADVATFDHGVTGAAELALAPAHDLADLGVPCHDRHRSVDLRLADPPRDVLARDLDVPRRAERHGIGVRERLERRTVVEGHSFVEREPRQRAVHRPGVEVPESEPVRERPGDRALPRSRGPVDRHDHRAGG